MQALSFLLRMGEIGLGCPVEIEFALKLRRSPSAKHELHVLQVRPQSEVAEPTASALRFRCLPSKRCAAVASARALGHGSFDDITDIVYVSPERMDMQKTKEIAIEISMLNRQLASAGRRYLLMAPGRWGTADAARGIPVSWMDIDNAGFIVESAVPGSSVPLSQGSHFFQNIISFGIGYATTDPSGEGGEVADYSYWDSLPAVAESVPTRHARHVRMDRPLEIVVDGLSRQGVVMKPGHPFELHVGQVFATLLPSVLRTRSLTALSTPPPPPLFYASLCPFRSSLSARLSLPWSSPHPSLIPFHPPAMRPVPCYARLLHPIRAPLPSFHDLPSCTGGFVHCTARIPRQLLQLGKSSPSALPRSLSDCSDRVLPSSLLLLA